MNILNYLQFFPQFLIAFSLTLLVTPLIGHIAKKYNIYDLPGSLRRKTDPTAQRRIHTVPKPKLGGVGVIVVFLILTLLTVPSTKSLWGVLLGTCVLLVMGIIDDIYDISARYQLICHFLAAILVVAAGKEILFVSNPFGGYIFFNQITINIHGIIRYFPASLITVGWIVFIINSIKWVAGTDGLVEGNSAIAALILGLLSVRFQTWPTAAMGFIFAGSLLGFLPYNFYPSKIFSGSSGKSVYGFILAVLSIYSGGKIATAVLTLSLPVIDALWVIYTRIRENKPKSILSLMSINDKNHFHHKLLGLGFNHREIAYVEYTITLILGSLALIFTGMHKALAIFIAGCIILVSLFIITKAIKGKGKYTQSNNRENSESKYVY